MPWGLELGDGRKSGEEDDGKDGAQYQAAKNV